MTQYMYRSLDFSADVSLRSESILFPHECV